MVRQTNSRWVRSFINQYKMIVIKPPPPHCCLQVAPSLPPACYFLCVSSRSTLDSVVESFGF